MKIHIVRKGDTLWEIAKQYGVDFEELKNFNSQLSSPDMIMPGMKIKIPTATKSVKKETVSVKESKVPIPKETPKQSPVIQEDDHEKPKEVKIEMPKKHTPQKPIQPLTQKKEVPIVKAPMKTPVKPMKEMIKLPVMEEETPIKLPETSQPKKPKEPQKEQIPLESPIFHHYYHHCCAPGYHPCFHVMGDMTGGFMPHHHMNQGYMMEPMPPQPHQMMHPHNCGCQGEMPQYQMREQEPARGYPEQVLPLGYQPYMTEPPMHPNFTNGLNTTVAKPFPMPPTYPTFSEFNIEDGKQVQQIQKDEPSNK